MQELGIGHAGGFGHSEVALVPAEDFVGGDVESVADGLSVAQEPHEALGKISIVGVGPERGTITGHDHREPAPHAVHDGVAAEKAVYGEWDECLAVGVGGSDDHAGKGFLTQCSEEAILTGNFIAGIVPEGIGQRGGLGDEVVRDGPLVGAGGADEDILGCATTEEAQVALDVQGREGDEVDDDIPRQARQSLCRGGFVVVVGDDDFGSGGSLRALASI